VRGSRASSASPRSKPARHAPLPRPVSFASSCHSLPSSCSLIYLTSLYPPTTRLMHGLLFVLTRVHDPPSSKLRAPRSDAAARQALCVRPQQRPLSLSRAAPTATIGNALLAAAPPRRSGVASPHARCADVGPAVARRQPEDEVTGGAWRARGVAMAPSDAAGVGTRHERRPGCSTSAGTTPPRPHHPPPPLRRQLRSIRPYRRADDIFQACARSRQASPLRRRKAFMPLLALPRRPRTGTRHGRRRRATRAQGRRRSSSWRMRWRSVVPDASLLSSRC
jgi:hypothetical protein